MALYTKLRHSHKIVTIAAWALAAMLPAHAQAPQAVQLASHQRFTYPISGSWVLGSERIEFRLEDVPQTSVPFHRWIFQGGFAYCRIEASQQILNCTDSRDSVLVYTQISGRSDIRVRLMRNLAAQTFTVETWDGRGGSYTYGAISIAGTPYSAADAMTLLGAYGSPSAGGRLGFFRWYSTLAPVSEAPPAEAPATPAQRGDFRFQGTLADSGPAALTLNLNTGSASYFDSAVYPPLALISDAPVTRATQQIQVSGTRSFTSQLGDGVPMLFWQQLGGPASANISSRTAATVGLTLPLAGTYTMQLTATDPQGITDKATKEIGAVSTDSRGVVITGNATMDRLLGPLTRSGTSPWPYYDLTERALAESLATSALANPPTLGPAKTGTARVFTQPARLVGTGTLFTQELNVGDVVVVAWDTIDGPGTGRFVDRVTEIIDDTHLTLSLYDIQIDLSVSITIYESPGETPTFSAGWWGLNAAAGTNSWNYYDVALAMYRLYFRTGQQRYLDYARQFSDYWWEWGIDHGRSGAFPRVAALQSQFLRALDGKPERFPEIYKLVDYFTRVINFNNPSPGADAREAGYAQWFVALGAKADPDAARHAQYCTWLNQKTPQWISYQNAEGYWSEDNYSHTAGLPYKPPGTAPWRTDIPIRGLQATYEVLNDTSTSGCNSPSLAAQLLDTIEDAVRFTYLYGRASNRGVYYSVQYETSASTATFPAGTVSVNLGSDTVTGTGTTFLESFPCSGIDYIAFEASRKIYKVASCQSDGTLTIAPAYGSQGEQSNLVNSGYATVLGTSTDCTISVANYCEFGPEGDRNLTRLMPGMTGWMYNHTGNPLYLEWADEWFSAAFGGPADGPGGLAPCGGPGCDGLMTDYGGALANCATSQPPCFFGGGPFLYLGKNYGQGSGAAGAQEHLAYRVGGFEPVTLVPIRVSLAGLAPGVSAILEVTEPSGRMTSTVCTTTPCVVTADSRQGNHLLRIRYLAGGTTPISTSESMILVVP